MTVPTSTYRLQLRNGMTFAEAAKFAPYLSQLGISHVYLSPIFRAAPGSTHGYDTVDFNEVDPSLGGLDCFRALISELKKHSLGAIVDLVPNHMAAHPENPWWRDVLEWGALSRYARHFDIDWSAPKLLVPFLGKQYGDCLQEREITVEFAPEMGEFAVRYYDKRLPLDPRSYGRVLGNVDDRDLRDIGAAMSQSGPETAAAIKRSLMYLAASKGKEIDDALNGLNANTSALHAILETQSWRLAYWRTARDMLTYRRFFEISDLVGVRVERPDVFEDVHRTILELVKDSLIDGLRIDHVDGLADPLGYLRRLREETSETPGFYLVVEKILGEKEDVRPDWPIDGTTGYEFIREIAGLFVRPDLDDLDEGYREFTGVSHDYDAEVLDIKRRTLAFNLASELNGLVSAAFALGQADVATRDFGRDTLRSAIIEVAAHFPVYRTYVTAPPSALDLEILTGVSRSAKATRKVEDHAAIDFIIALLSGGQSSNVDSRSADAFVVRFQQTTGPLMAKAVEDTEFYRFNRLIALNEVGGEPILAATGPDRFHAAMLKRQSLSPRALTATATHDTKRGEDARARLYAVSYMQTEWCAAVRRWSRELASDDVREDATAPDRESEWLFYEALAGAWPGKSAVSADLTERMVQFMLKAAREAKLRTSWTDPDCAYEARLERFVRRALDPEGGFVEDFERTIQPLITAGTALSLMQTVLKVFAPGIPDIYQGTELLDLSFVDPDNRSAVDYGLRADILSRSDGNLSRQAMLDGSLKLELLRRSLALRQTFDLTAASYHSLAVEGQEAPRVIAFARHTDENAMIVVGAICGPGDFQRHHGIAFDAGSWRETKVRLSPSLKKYQFANAFLETLRPIDRDYIDVAGALGHLPVAVLHSAG